MRTNHLDDYRIDKQRDYGYTCEKFEKIIEILFKKRPLGIDSGKYNLIFKENGDYQSVIIAVDKTNKKITFITIMNLNLNSIHDYKYKKDTRRIFLGKLN